MITYNCSFFEAIFLYYKDLLNNINGEDIKDLTLVGNRIFEEEKCQTYCLILSSQNFLKSRSHLLLCFILLIMVLITTFIQNKVNILFIVSVCKLHFVFYVF